MKYNRQILNILLPILLSLSLLLSCLIPIHTESLSNNLASTDVQPKEATEQTITKGGITYRLRTDGYYDVIGYDKNISNPESFFLQLGKMDINKAPSEVVTNNPSYYVASIAEGVFQDCTFAAISLTGDIDIGAHAFERTTTTDTNNYYSLNGTFLGNSNATIGDYAFANATFNHEVITDACSIGKHAFEGASFSASGFSFLYPSSTPSSPRTIGDYAFAGTNLTSTSITLPDGLTYLGIMAFPNVETLTITIPNSITNIDAFHLESLTNVTFNISYINPAYTTLKNMGLKTSLIDNPDLYIPLYPPTTQTTTATTPNGTDKLITRKNAVYKITGTSTAAFIRPTSKKVTSLTIPAQIKVQGKKYKITKVAAKAALGCKKLKRVTLGKNITTIGNSAFAQCTALEQITFGKGITTLGKRVLYNDKKIKKIRFQSKKIKSIGKKTFFNVPKTVNIQVPTSKVSHYVKLINKAK